MSESFGSDSFFRQMKEAQQAQDRDRLGALLWPHVQRIGNFILRRSAYSYYSFQDRQDALQDAALYVLGAIDGFLDDPRNDPAAEAAARYSEKGKMSWLYQYVFNGIRHSADKVLKNRHDSLDRPVSCQEDGAVRAVFRDGGLRAQGRLLTEAGDTPLTFTQGQAQAALPPDDFCTLELFFTE